MFFLLIKSKRFTFESLDTKIIVQYKKDRNSKLNIKQVTVIYSERDCSRTLTVFIGRQPELEKRESGKGPELFVAVNLIGATVCHLVYNQLEKGKPLSLFFYHFLFFFLLIESSSQARSIGSNECVEFVALSVYSWRSILSFYYFFSFTSKELLDTTTALVASWGMRRYIALRLSGDSPTRQVKKKKGKQKQKPPVPRKDTRK